MDRQRPGDAMAQIDGYGAVQPAHRHVEHSSIFERMFDSVKRLAFFPKRTAEPRSHMIFITAKFRVRPEYADAGRISPGRSPSDAQRARLPLV